jgi:hypothetical protein
MPKFVIAAVLLLTACANWSKPGANSADLTAAESACNQQALDEAPLAMTSMADAGPGANAPGYSCTNRGCVPSSNEVPGAGLGDANASRRSVLFAQCMQQHGWTR